MAQERILISSDWGKVNAELIDNNATRSLVQMMPLTIEMRDHLRQEKTGYQPSALPAVQPAARFLDRYSWELRSSNHFVIYYRDGRVPQPGIILLGQVMGDVLIFRPARSSNRPNRTYQVTISRRPKLHQALRRHHRLRILRVCRPECGSGSRPAHRGRARPGMAESARRSRVSAKKAGVSTAAAEPEPWVRAKLPGAGSKGAGNAASSGG